MTDHELKLPGPAPTLRDPLTMLDQDRLITTGTEGVLPVARKALQQARRVLDELPSKEASGIAFRDFLPRAPDRLDNVWRTIDSESEGDRTDQFGQWWATQKSRNRVAVKALRNAGVKDNTQTAAGEHILRAERYMRVHEDGRISAHRRDDDSEVPLLEDGSLDLGELEPQSSSWQFVVPGLEGRAVQEVLETVYKRLAEEVLPTAERLLERTVREEGPLVD